MRDLEGGVGWWIRKDRVRITDREGPKKDRDSWWPVRVYSWGRNGDHPEGVDDMGVYFENPPLTGLVGNR